MSPKLPFAQPARAALEPTEFVAWLRREGESRYHTRHPFHERMHTGKLSASELRRWATNRYYYQTRIPIKDALIISKSEDSAFRRQWLRRVVDHDGATPGEGGLELWLRLGEALGVARVSMLSLEGVEPGVRFACDAYVTFVKERSLLEGVAASLTELFAPDLMSQRIAAFERHYDFIDKSGLAYFRARVPRAAYDAREALAFVTANAKTFEQQSACVDALVYKTQILWHLLDCVAGHSGAEHARHASSS
jgi:pyrroloquinoline-quinone synthase